MLDHGALLSITHTHTHRRRRRHIAPAHVHTQATGGAYECCMDDTNRCLIHIINQCASLPALSVRPAYIATLTCAWKEEGNQSSYQTAQHRARRWQHPCIG